MISVFVSNGIVCQRNKYVLSGVKFNNNNRQITIVVILVFPIGFHFNISCSHLPHVIFSFHRDEYEKNIN